MTEGPRLSLKAIAEQAVRAKQEGQSETAQQPIAPSGAQSPPDLAASFIEPPSRLPAPPPMPRGVARPHERATPSTNLLLPATLIAIVSAALAGGVVWWFAQGATPTPTAPSQPTNVAPPTLAPTPAATASIAATAAVAPTALLTAEPSAQPTTLEALPAAAATSSTRGATKAQSAKSEQQSSVDPAKVIATLGSSQGPVLAGSSAGTDPPMAAPGGAQLSPSNLTPSSGAVQAAVGSVLGNARVCVAGDREPSRARVIFESSGAVSGVVVSGPAAGTPAEACIKAALSKARVAPFQKPNYSVDTTIRP